MKNLIKHIDIEIDILRKQEPLRYDWHIYFGTLNRTLLSNYEVFGKYYVLALINKPIKKSEDDIQGQEVNYEEEEEARGFFKLRNEYDLEKYIYDSKNGIISFRKKLTGEMTDFYIGYRPCDSKIYSAIKRALRKKKEKFL